MMYAGDEHYTDDITSGTPPEPEHEGCECAICDGIIEDDSEGESSYSGSVHIWCARRIPGKPPTEWRW
jgi:hypothetical protein